MSLSNLCSWENNENIVLILDFFVYFCVFTFLKKKDILCLAVSLLLYRTEYLVCFTAFIRYSHKCDICGDYIFKWFLVTGPLGLTYFLELNSNTSTHTHTHTHIPFLYVDICMCIYTHMYLYTCLCGSLYSHIYRCRCKCKHRHTHIAIYKRRTSKSAALEPKTLDNIE